MLLLTEEPCQVIGLSEGQTRKLTNVSRTQDGKLVHTLFPKKNIYGKKTCSSTYKTVLETPSTNLCQGRSCNCWPFPQVGQE